MNTVNRRKISWYHERRPRLASIVACHSGPVEEEPAFTLGVSPHRLLGKRFARGEISLPTIKPTTFLPQTY